MVANVARQHRDVGEIKHKMFFIHDRPVRAGHIFLDRFRFDLASKETYCQRLNHCLVRLKKRYRNLQSFP